MQRLDALGVLFVGRVQRIQLFVVDDVEEPLARHGPLQAQAALSFADFLRRIVGLFAEKDQEIWPNPAYL